MTDITIRPFRAEDAQAAAELFFDTVRNAAGPAYDEKQREAWAPASRDIDKWQARLVGMTTLIAEDEKGIAGFMTLEPDGHIDLAYVRADAIGRGVAKALYDVIEGQAARLGIPRLYSEASETAKVFFARQDWSMIAPQTVSPNGVPMTNYRMEKHLDKADGSG